MNQVLLTLVFLVGTLSFRVAFAAAESTANPLKISLRPLETGGGQIEVLATVHGAPNIPSLQTVERGQELRSSAVKQALDLWLVLDNSALCAKYKADQTLAAWATGLARELPTNSRLSLLTFRRGAFEMLATQQSMDSLPLGKLRCQAGSVSAEPERALTYVNETEIPVGLTRAVWIVSSGNASISQKTLAKLRETDTELSLFFYNPFVFTALAPLFDSMRSTLGDGLFTAQVLDSADLPSHTYRLTASLPSEVANSVTVVAHVQNADRKTTSRPVSVKLPPSNGPSVLHKILVILGYISFVLALGYATYRIARYYRPRYCRHCKTRLRFSDSTCGFCFEAEGAYLVATKTPATVHTPMRTLVSTLDKEQIQVGTHRRSSIGILRRLGEKRSVYFRIHRRGGTFRLQPTGVPVYVNGLPVTTARFLASGDRIHVRGSDFKFVQNSRGTQRV